MRGRDTLSGQQINPVIAHRAWQLRRQMTPAETLLWQGSRANRLAGFHFRRQQVVAGFIVDFYCHAARLVVELDGDIHLQQVQADLERQGILAGYGLRILRFSNHAVQQDLSQVLLDIQTELPESGSPFPRGEGG
jgi:very-short-patch-repair endonuclease